jgi:hypothetical protein
MRRYDSRLLLMALDLAVPPLSLLVMLWVGTLLLTLLGLPAGVTLPFVACCLLGGLLLSAVVAGWYRFARNVIPARQLLAIPLYLLWKIPIYLRFLRRRERTWVRTDRGKA